MAKPNLALIPAAQGTKLYSVLPSDGSGDFDYTRGSSATRINAQGLIETVANTSSRLNYPLLDGKVVGCPHHILEPQRTNLLPYSEDFSNSNGWAQGNVTLTANQTISPSGNNDAYLMLDNTVSGEHYILSSAATTIGAGTFTYSVFAKYNGSQWFAIYSNVSGIAYFDIQNGIIGTTTGGTSTIEPYLNGWYKCTLTAAQSGNSRMLIAGASSNGVLSYAPSGTTGRYIYGAQVESGSFPTSYIKSSGNPTTRLAESATGSGSAATFNDSEGVFMAEISALANDGTYRQFGITGSFSNEVNLSLDNVSNRISGVVRSSGTYYVITHLFSDTTTFFKLALKYKLNDVKLFVNGFEVGSKISANMPIGLNELNFAVGTFNENPFYGKTKQIQYFDSADIDLEELTSWDSFSDMANGQLYTIE